MMPKHGAETKEMLSCPGYAQFLTIEVAGHSGKNVKEATVVRQMLCLVDELTRQGMRLLCCQKKVHLTLKEHLRRKVRDASIVEVFFDNCSTRPNVLGICSSW